MTKYFRSHLKFETSEIADFSLKKLDPVIANFSGTYTNLLHHEVILSASSNIFTLNFNGLFDPIDLIFAIKQIIVVNKHPTEPVQFTNWVVRNSYTAQAAGDFSFHASVADGTHSSSTIVDAKSGFLDGSSTNAFGWFAGGSPLIAVTGSVANNGNYAIYSASASTIKLAPSVTLVDALPDAGTPKIVFYYRNNNLIAPNSFIVLSGTDTVTTTDPHIESANSAWQITLNDSSASNVPLDIYILGT